MVVIFKLDVNSKLYQETYYDDLYLVGDGMVAYLNDIGEIESIEQMEWFPNGSVKTILSNGEQVFAELH